VTWPPVIKFGEHVCGSRQQPERVRVRDLWLLVCGNCQNFIRHECKGRTDAYRPRQRPALSSQAPPGRHSAAARAKAVGLSDHV
jgi:hypothetical protein